MNGSEDGHLLSVASSISDGKPVDWTHGPSPTADPHTARVFSEMALVEKIATFHREMGVSSTPTAAGMSQPEDPHTWGHFRILERIGVGTFGAIYRARDTRLDAEVALKLLWPDPPGRPANPIRSLKEARLLARVRHPHVVSVHGADYIDGRVGIWMELVKGRTFAQVLKDQGSFSAREAALIGFDVCRALAAVHRAKLLHGDVKAHNVMREEGGRTVLMDFGTGKDLLVDDILARDAATDFAGTPLYVAPEVFAGQKRTKVSDVYSVGVLVFHLVTGEYPVDGRTRADVERAHERGERRQLRDARPDLPEDFVRAVERALAPDPSERHQSAGAFEAALGSVLGRSDVDPAARGRLSWPAIAAALAAVVIAGVIVSRLAPWTSSRSTQIAAQPAPIAAASSPAPAAAAGPSYQIDTAFYRARGKREDRLSPGARLEPGDTLFARVRVSVPAYVYIVNEDDHGESYLLFPLPGQRLTNPIPAGTTNRIPEATADTEINWQVSSAGGREHFLLFASPERMPVFEQTFAALPHPEIGKPVVSAHLSADTVQRLRGVGGLTVSPARQNAPPRLALQFATPLGDAEETARGLWVRQLTVENPVGGR